jgi:hypothetical protein
MRRSAPPSGSTTQRGGKDALEDLLEEGRDRALGASLACVRSYARILGFLWLADAGLALQPALWRPAFPASFVGYGTLGTPAPLAELIRSLLPLVMSFPWLVSGFLVLAQAFVGACLVTGRAPRAGLVASVGLALVIWTVGEGMGGSLLPGAAVVTGFPGAALVYALESVVLLVGADGSGRAWRRSMRLAATFVFATWLLASGVGAYWLASHPSAFGESFDGLADGEPRVLAAVNTAEAHLASGGPLAWSLVVALPLVLALLVAFGRTRRASLLAGAAVALVFWAVGQDFGSVLTAQASDVGSGPPLLLLSAMAGGWWVASRPIGRRARTG